MRAGFITMSWGWRAMQVRIRLSREGLKRDVKRMADEALTDYRDEIIEDMNVLVPVSGGASLTGGGGSLRRSAFTGSDKRARDGALTVRWNTPYAHYQHQGLVMRGTPGNRTYGPERLSYTSATARARWTDQAERLYGKRWEKDIQKLMGSSETGSTRNFRRRRRPWRSFPTTGGSIWRSGREPMKGGT